MTIKRGRGGISKRESTLVCETGIFSIDYLIVISSISYGLSMNEAASKLARLFRLFANMDPREIVHRRFSCRFLVNLVSLHVSRSTTRFNAVFCHFSILLPSPLPLLFPPTPYFLRFSRGRTLKTNVFVSRYSRWRRNRETITCSVGIYHVVWESRSLFVKIITTS